MHGRLRTRRARSSRAGCSTAQHGAARGSPQAGVALRLGAELARLVAVVGHALRRGVPWCCWLEADGAAGAERLVVSRGCPLSRCPSTPRPTHLVHRGGELAVLAATSANGGVVPVGRGGKLLVRLDGGGRREGRAAGAAAAALRHACAPGGTAPSGQLAGCDQTCVRGTRAQGRCGACSAGRLREVQRQQRRCSMQRAVARAAPASPLAAPPRSASPRPCHSPEPVFEQHLAHFRPVAEEGRAESLQRGLGHAALGNRVAAANNLLLDLHPGGAAGGRGIWSGASKGRGAWPVVPPV